MVCCFISLCACYKPQTSVVEREPKSLLTREYAEFRARQIDHVQYHYEVDISQRGYFQGRADITFDLAAADISPVTIDFLDGTIAYASVNGASVPLDNPDGFIRVPGELLVSGTNKIIIDYRQDYSASGQGLHQFQDAETGNYYLYTQFEAYDGHRFAPMFDQPDIKARFSMTVIAPPTWEVISATRETTRELQPDGNRRWQFPRTEIIPTYIFSLHAGPFEHWDDQYGDIPLRLFARQEMAQYIDAEEWFFVTKELFSIMEAFFAYPYPFAKYDQLVVPDFNFGAMENVGAVTFAEHLISRVEPTEDQKSRLARIIAHEMAHMWFGNVVTMTWWNGLWLNESFATVLAYFTMAQVPGFEDTWTYFSSLKGWAYREDQLVTTHPIETPVPDTSEVLNLVDGISYGKGASVLKQLIYFIGEDRFQEALAQYVAEHAFANTQLDDFAAAIADASDKNMDEWVEQWLLAPGLNSIETQVSCTGDALSGVTIHQYAPADWPTLRTQKILLGLFARNTSSMTLTGTMPVIYTGAQTQVSLPAEPLPCPDFVYPNLEDWGYLKLRLDPADIATLSESINHFEDPAMRLSLWQALWQQVQDVQMPLPRFQAIVANNIGAESDSAVLAYLLNLQPHAFDLAEAMALGETSTALQGAIEHTLWREFERSPAGSSRQKKFLDAAIATTVSAAKLQRLEHYLRGRRALEGLPLDADTRWQMIVQLNRYDYPTAETLAAEEVARDASENARLAALAASVIRPDMNVKRSWLKKITAPDTELKQADLAVIMMSLFPGAQQHFRTELSEAIWRAANELNEQQSVIYFREFGEFLLPGACTPESNAALASKLSTDERFNAVLSKKLKIAHQDDVRCVRQKSLINKMNKPT